MGIAAYFASLDISTLPGRIPGGGAQGMIWGLMALGVYITFRVLNTADMTVDGSFATGGACAVMLITGGCPAWLALLAAMLAGVLAGLCTGFLHTKLGIPAILSGILTQFALYSINLHIMNESANQAVSAKKFRLIITSGSVPAAIATGLVFAAAVIGLLYWYFGTEQGSAMRATGNNPSMSRAQGININNMKLAGLALSNGLVALSGALMAQFQGFADVNMGRGAIVIGLAAIVIGEVVCDSIFGESCNFALRLSCVVLGGVLYYMVMTVILWLRLDPNDLKLFTALIVAGFLSVPQWKARRSRTLHKGGGK